ncbi:MAG: T9SS type A sorting domain-containing protein [Bacteroidetes bacterium]|nr:T9SS type A sorting domain-containing protein [Bacteroidota bacterium]
MKWMLFVAMFLCATALYAQQKLAITFIGMTPHVGQLFQLRVVDKASGLEAAHHTIPSLASASFTLEMFCLEKGKSYAIDFYADLNKNGRYDAPPTDHAWRLTADNVSANVNMDFMHNTTWTDIAYPSSPTSYPNHIEQAWSGTWKNLTFSTTGDIASTITFDFVTKRVTGSATTAGAFGNPSPITITAEGTFDPDADTAYLTPTAPASAQGNIRFQRGVLSGSISMSGVTLALAGDYGTNQMAMTYAMSGAFTANGTMILQRGAVTGVEVEGGMVEGVSVIPQPSRDVVGLQWQQMGSETARVDVFDPQGRLLLTSFDQAATTSHTLLLNVQAFPVGTYMARITAGSSVTTVPIVINR